MDNKILRLKAQNDIDVMERNMYKNIQRKSDGSFVLEKNGYPYHLPNTDEFKEEYEFVEKYAAAYPEEVAEYVEPVVEQPAPVDERVVRLKELEKEADSLFQDITADIASDDDKSRFKELRLEIKALKAEIEAD